MRRMDYDPADHSPTARQVVAGWLACAAIACSALGLPALWGEMSPRDPVAITVAGRPALGGVCNHHDVNAKTLECVLKAGRATIADRGTRLASVGSQPCS
jgi:hypothetical protein